MPLTTLRMLALSALSGLAISLIAMLSACGGGSEALPPAAPAQPAPPPTPAPRPAASSADIAAAVALFTTPLNWLQYINAAAAVLLDDDARLQTCEVGTYAARMNGAEVLPGTVVAMPATLAVDFSGCRRDGIALDGSVQSQLRLDGGWRRSEAGSIGLRVRDANAAVDVVVAGTWLGDDQTTFRDGYRRWDWRGQPQPGASLINQHSMRALVVGGGALRGTQTDVRVNDQWVALTSGVEVDAFSYVVEGRSVRLDGALRFRFNEKLQTVAGTGEVRVLVDGAVVARVFPDDTGRLTADVTGTVPRL